MKSAPKVLYHYTNSDGIIGVVTNKCLWLTDYRSLNDRSEIDYALEVIEDTVSKHKKLKAISSRFDWKSIFKKNRQGQVLLVGSFAETPDNPVLWRLYSKQKGYVLGMSSATLSNALKPIGNSQLGRVIYKLRTQRELISSSFDAFLSKLPDEKKMPESAKQMSSFFERINFFFWVYKVAPFLKHSSFEQEAEWRVSVHFRSKGGLKFRSRGEDIVPYFELKLPEKSRNNDLDWIESIDIGPQSHRVKNIAQLEALLDMNGFRNSNVLFSQSDLPF